jgi:hypothetical protein
MATRTATRIAAEKAEATQAKSAANTNGIPAEVREELRRKRAEGVTVAELRKAFPDYGLIAIRSAVADVIPPTKAKRAGNGAAKVETKRVRPVEPDYSKLPESKREAARKRYERAVAQFTGGVSEVPTVTAKKAPKAAKSQPKAKASAKAKPAGRPRATIEPPKGFGSWDDAKLAARVLREKAKGSTIKQISAGLGLPEEERYFHRVSLVYRAAADAKGIERPRLSAEVIESRKQKASA